MLKPKTLEIIADWLNTNEKLREINNYLFKNTELFEQKYESEYKQELFSFFAGKITRFTNDYNKIMNLLTPQESKEIQYKRIIRR